MAKAPATKVRDQLRDDVAPALFEVTDAGDHVLTLAERFLIPPFSVLDSRSGWWQERKRLWGNLGLKSEVGRSARTFAESGGADEVSQKILALSDGQSIFDPVLCEMAYRWFSPPAGRILDPFAGGSVRGIVAGVLGRQYVGVDLSTTQVVANRAQVPSFMAAGLLAQENKPYWVDGDSSEVLVPRERREETFEFEDPFDFVFSCPPYGDLEKYSDDPRDLSNMEWADFLGLYREIIAYSVARLTDDAFCGFVVGEIRDKKTGTYRNFVGETVDAFEDAGAGFYNEAIIVNPAGTLPLRAANQFQATRKIGKTHQNCLFFVKGDPKKAAAKCDPSAVEGVMRSLAVTDLVPEGEE